VAVADDDRAILAVVADVLRLDGYRVHEADDGEQLLFCIIRAFAPNTRAMAAIDLVVSDMWMPFCSGLDILVRLRERRSPTPVVIMTGDRDPSLRARVEQLGGTLLEKPFAMDDLRRAVRGALARAPQH
jgi:DNA-binding response OmpR family regulator